MNLHKRMRNFPIIRRTRIRGNTTLIIHIHGNSVTKLRANMLLKSIEKAIRDSGLGPALKYSKSIRS